MNINTRLNTAFSALCDPTRRAILERLRAGEATVMELAKPFDLTQPTVSKHLRVLEEAGLISRGRDAQRRPCRIRPEGLRDAAEWFLGFRHFWESSFARLDDLLTDDSESSSHDGGKHE